jgi:molybdopterin synthase sulfur carrier subunit
MIKVLLFAGLKERAGTDKVHIDAEALTVKEIKERLFKDIPALDHLEESLVAVNEAYAEDGRIVTENDAVAIIPPVSGG